MDGRPVQVLEGPRRRLSIFHCGDGFFYNIREVRQHRVRLACRHKFRQNACHGTASVSLLSGILRSHSPHNHPPDPLLPQDLALRRRMIEEATSNRRGRRIRSILDELKFSVQNPELALRFTRARMCTALHIARSRNYPTIPNSLIHLGALLGTPQFRPLCETIDGADCLYQGVVGCEDFRTVAVVFVSRRMLHFLQTRESVHLDGTFRKRPNKPKTSQIFNVVAKHGDHIIGIVRVLMLSRTEAAYLEVFNYLKFIAPNFQPRRVHCDFERPLMNAVRSAFPLCRVVGCLWHYAVCVSRKSRSLGLAPIARQSPVVMACVTSLCAAPLLPQHLLWQGIVELWREVETLGWGVQLRPLFEYWEETWKPRIAELSVFGDHDRTNNCSESDNRMLANAIPNNSPNIWFLIGGFVQLEYLAWCDKLAADQLRQVARSRSYRTLATDRKVRMASRMLLNGDITPGHFLCTTSHSILAATQYGLHLHQNDGNQDDS